MQVVKKHLYKWLLLVIIVICTLLMLMATVAFWTQELWVNNEYQLGKYSTKIEEEFEAPVDWSPGENVNKDVFVVNDGTVPVFTKVQINLKWFGQDEFTKEDYALVFDVEEAKEYAALISWGKEVMLLSSGISSTESLGLGLPVAQTMTDAHGKWLLLDEEPDEEGNLMFYYMGILEKGEKTPLLVDGVKMNPKIEAKIMEIQTIYNKESKVWQTKYKENPSFSYEDARFLLTVKAQTVQANSDAISEVFASNTTTEQAVVNYLGTIGMNFGQVIKGQTAEKELYFTQAGEEIRFTPIGGDGQKWFMSFLDMVPGGQYVDKLHIENRSKQDYDLYMQVVPKVGQSETLNELLELINMKVYLKESLIYEGRATGKTYPKGNGDLQAAVLLGKYAAGMKDTMRVELELSKDTSMEYCELLTKIDWKFIATKVEQQEKKEPLKTTRQPKTGDEVTVVKYIIVMVATAIVLLGCVHILKRQRKDGGKR